MRKLRNRNRLACAVTAALGITCCGIGTHVRAAEPTDSGLSLTPASVRAIYADVPNQGPGSPATGPSGTAEAPGSSAPTPPPQATTPPRKPLMRVMDAIGIGKGLDDLGINIYGWVEGSYTYSASAPPGNIITGRVFDLTHEDPTLNQVDLNFEKTVDLTKKEWQWGFHIEGLYGADAGGIHALGLFDWYDGRFNPENQFDLVQAYADIGIPIGNGLQLRLGKWVTLLGQEVINPTGNALFSHSYLFGFAIPFTHTGVLGTYAFNDQFTLDLGVTRGWDVSLEDNNSALDYIGRVTWTLPDKKNKIFATLISGPEQTGNDGRWRTVFDLIWTYQATDALSFAVNGDYGFDSGASPTGGDAMWYGVAAYMGYKFNDYATLNLRGEFFRDEDGVRLGTGFGTNVYEATAGVTVTPFASDEIMQNLKIRPEVRFDYSENKIFDAGTDRYQFTAGIDAYFTF